MRNYILFILLISWFNQLTSQSIVYRTNWSDNKLTQSNSEGIVRSDKIKQSNKGYSIKFTGSNSNITTYKITNPGKIELSHLIARKGDQLAFSIYYSTDKENWKRINSLPSPILFQNPSSLDTVLTTKSYNLDLVGEYYIKFLIEHYVSGSFQIDEIKIIETNIKIINQENERQEKERELSEQIERIKSELSFSQFNETLDELKEKYVNQIDNYALLLNKIGDLNILYNMTLFMYDRTKMVSPSEYEDFSNILRDVKTQADTLDKIMIVQLEESLKAPSYPVEKKKKPLGLLRVGYNLGNILTGGKLESVINSFKGVLARTYSTTNLLINEMQQPNQSIFQKIPKKGGNIILNTNQIEKIRSQSLQGVKNFENLSIFFSIIQDEHTHLEELIRTMESSNVQLTELENMLTKDITLFFALIEVEISDYNIHQLQTGKEKVTGQLRKQTINYFEKMIVHDAFQYDNRKKELQTNLEGIDLRLKKFEDVLNKYYSQIENLNNLATGFKDDLTRENPFTKQKDKFLNSFNQWNSLKNETISKIQTIPNDININYLEYVKNSIK